MTFHSRKNYSRTIPALFRVSKSSADKATEAQTHALQLGAAAHAVQHSEAVPLR